MPAMQGAPPRQNAESLPGPNPPRKAPLRTRARAAVVLWASAALMAAASLTGCEYTYDEGWRPPDSVPAPAITDQSFPRDPLRNEPVTEAELEDWVEEELPYTERPVVHTDFGILTGGEIKSDTAAGLPAGTYALALVCRSQRRVTFTVRSDEFTLVELSLRCGSTRENVIYLSKDSALSFRVEPRSLANYAYRLTRLGAPG
ncbi:hypothetical protein [Pseudarthrobacter sp. CCNWLW207]|uniref:hypothetical protein n=1 Tax=Pseudarthrobacter sp. CCNWLW207 TaxID=3127468 RepID=UPI003077FE76